MGNSNNRESDVKEVELSCGSRQSGCELLKSKTGSNFLQSEIKITNDRVGKRQKWSEFYLTTATYFRQLPVVLDHLSPLVPVSWFRICYHCRRKRRSTLCRWQESELSQSHSGISCWYQRQPASVVQAFPRIHDNLPAVVSTVVANSKRRVFLTCAITVFRDHTQLMPAEAAYLNALLSGHDIHNSRSCASSALSLHTNLKHLISHKNGIDKGGLGLRPCKPEASSEQLCPETGHEWVQMRSTTEESQSSKVFALDLRNN